MKVLLSVASLLPAYGGPAFSVSQLATALAGIGATVGLWAPDGSAVSSPLVADGRIVRLEGSASGAVARFGRPDVIHDNGIWLPHNHRLALEARTLAAPRLVSTRGMLEPWARRHKAWKKRLAWALYQRHDLRTAAHLHATAEAEAENLAKLALGVPVTTIPNGIDLPRGPIDRPARPGAAGRTALFLGRLYPVKGLPMLIQAWSEVRPAGWRLRIAGPDEAGHQGELERLVAAHGLGRVVEFCGALHDDEKRAAFMAADLFVLPSHSESFGMAVGEALAHGLPVLTTTAAPWPSLRQQGCGWSVEPSAVAIAVGLREAASRSAAELEAMGARGRALIEASYSWENAAAAFGQLYETMVAQGDLGRIQAEPRPL